MIVVVDLLPWVCSLGFRVTPRWGWCCELSLRVFLCPQIFLALMRLLPQIGTAWKDRATVKVHLGWEGRTIFPGRCKFIL